MALTKLSMSFIEDQMSELQPARKDDDAVIPVATDDVGDHAVVEVVARILAMHLSVELGPVARLFPLYLWEQD